MSTFYKWRVSFTGESNTQIDVLVTADYHDVAVERAWYILEKAPTPEDECFQVTDVHRMRMVNKDSRSADWEIYKCGIYESECPYAE